MKKHGLVVVGMIIVTLLSSCSGSDFNEMIEEIGNRDTLTVLSFSKLDREFMSRRDFVETEKIEQVRDIFDNVEWGKDPEEERSDPNYQIEHYAIWLQDDTVFIDAMDLTNGKYAELTAEESTVVLNIIIDAFY